MKKLIYLVFLVFLILFSYNCKKCTIADGQRDSAMFELQAFDTLNVYDIFNVYIKQDSFYSVTVKADKSLINNINVSVHNNNAFIEDLNKCYFLKLKNKDIDIYVTAPDMKKIILYSASSVYSIDTLHFRRFGIKALGYYANADVTVDCEDHLFISVWNATGDFTAHGKAKFLQVLNHGKSYVHAFGLVCQYADIEQRSTGDVEVNVEKKLKAKLFDTGNVIYKGNPLIEAVVEGGGQIIHD